MAQPKSTERKLRTLRRQLSGREFSLQAKPQTLNYTLTNATASNQPTTSTEISYLRSDLLKIALLMSLAIGFQLLLFVLRNHGLKVMGF